MKLIYENKKPHFALLHDRFQWILATKLTKRGEWVHKSYFPTLSMLFGELIEHALRVYPTKVRELKDMDKRIDRVYDLIKTLTVDVPKRKLGGSSAKVR